MGGDEDEDKTAVCTTASAVQPTTEEAVVPDGAGEGMSSTDEDEEEAGNDEAGNAAAATAVAEAAENDEDGGDIEMATTEEDDEEAEAGTDRSTAIAASSGVELDAKTSDQNEEAGIGADSPICTTAQGAAEEGAAGMVNGEEVVAEGTGSMLDMQCDDVDASRSIEGDAACTADVNTGECQWMNFGRLGYKNNNCCHVLLLITGRIHVWEDSSGFGPLVALRSTSLLPGVCTCLALGAHRSNSFPLLFPVSTARPMSLACMEEVSHYVVFTG